MKTAYVAVLCLSGLFSVTASAGTILSGYTCNGSCGTDGADGDVPLSPIGSPAYSWVSTNGGIVGVGALPSGAVGLETNGSTPATPVFSATAGTALDFYFDYVTSDGSSVYSDYAWAELFTSTGTPVALIFTAQTEPTRLLPGRRITAPVSGNHADSLFGAHHAECYELVPPRHVVGPVLGRGLRQYRLGLVRLDYRFCGQLLP